MSVNRERFMAIFIGALMIFSLAGFAINSAIFRNPQEPTIQIPNIVERPLKPDEIVYILRTGRVIMRNYYTGEQIYSKILTDFAAKFKDYVVLESVRIAENETTKFEIVGSREGRIGDIKDLSNYTITDETLMDLLCEYAILQPKECLMREL